MVDEVKAVDPIQDLLDEVTNKQQEDAHWLLVKNRARKDSNVVHLDLRPDALVLLTVVAKCSCCKTEYPYPNKHVMIRYGNNILKHEPNGVTVALPREHKRLTYEVPFCEKCFGVADLIGEEDETSGGG